MNSFYIKDKPIIGGTAEDILKSKENYVAYQPIVLDKIK